MIKLNLRILDFISNLRNKTLTGQHNNAKGNGTDKTPQFIFAILTTINSHCVVQNHVIKNSNVNEVTMDYKKFLIVREPMERLVSAFNDLFIVSDRKGLQREALKVRGARNRKITFNDFIKAVVLPQDSVGNFNSDM